MPNNYLKNMLKITLITIISGAVLFMLSALILYKSSSAFGNYKFVSFVIVILVAFFVSVFTSKSAEKATIGASLLNLLPLILFIVLTAIFTPQGITIKAGILLLIVIAIGILIPKIITKKPKTKKRNMNKIRRDYERLRKR